MHLGEQRGTAIDLPPLGPEAALCNPLTSPPVSLALSPSSRFLSLSFPLAFSYAAGTHTVITLLSRVPFPEGQTSLSNNGPFSVTPSAGTFVPSLFVRALSSALLHSLRWLFLFAQQKAGTNGPLRLAFGWLYSNVARFRRNPFPVIEEISCSIIRHSLASTP